MVSNALNRQMRPIHLACLADNHDSVKLLLNTGARSCRTRNDNLSPEDYLRLNMREREQRGEYNEEERLKYEQTLALLATARSEQPREGRGSTLLCIIVVYLIRNYCK